jgi:hypothetical protein
MTSDHVPILATFINKKEKLQVFINKKFKAVWNKFKNNLPLGICNKVD